LWPRLASTQEPPASASQVLELQAWITTPRWSINLNSNIFLHVFLVNVLSMRMESFDEFPFGKIISSLFFLYYPFLVLKWTLKDSFSEESVIIWLHLVALCVFLFLGRITDHKLMQLYLDQKVFLLKRKIIISFKASSIFFLLFFPPS
jgi:hypothetical protein